MISILGQAPSNAISLPLGTGHGFHGWADKFVFVPTTGIEDTHLKAFYTIRTGTNSLLNGVKIDFRYHNFDTNEGGANYGDEINFKISKKFKDRYSVMQIMMLKIMLRIQKN